MEIMKQLYDIGSLLDPTEDVAIVAKTFDIFATTEIGYRKCETNATGVLDDILIPLYTFAVEVLKVLAIIKH